jgi:hypothetical protein
MRIPRVTAPWYWGIGMANLALAAYMPGPQPIGVWLGAINLVACICTLKKDGRS